MHWLLWTGESIFLGMVHYFYFLLFSLLLSVYIFSIEGLILDGGSVDKHCCSYMLMIK